jgi:hypothetical protein
MTYLFPIATTSTAGLVQAGANISIDANGVISTTGGGGSTSTTGTWTPTISVALAGTITLLVETARYAKIGQQVICYFDITIASCSLGANNNVLSMGGLPFTSIAGVGVVGSLVVSVFENLNNNWSYVSGTIEGNSTTVQLYTIHNATGNQRLTYADVQLTPLPTRLVGTITYLSAS